MEKNQIVEIKIEDISAEGLGIGHASGMAVFVKDTIPGDEARVKIIKLKKHIAYGRVMKILSPSEDRVPARCPVARQCGGCQIQEMDYAAQLRFKKRKVEENLRRIGGFQTVRVNNVLGMKDPWRYRNKAQFPVGRDRNGKLIAGFYAGRTHDIIDCHDCAIGVPQNREIIECVLAYMERFHVEPYDEAGAAAAAPAAGGKNRRNGTEAHTAVMAESNARRGKRGTDGYGKIRHIFTRIGFSTGQIMVVIVATSDRLPETDYLVEQLTKTRGVVSIIINVNAKNTNVILGDETHVLYGKDSIEDTISDVRYNISSRSFYQVNPAQTKVLYETALRFADLKGGENVWDLYCGTGTISLFLAKKAGHVTGVEVIPEAIENARQNARLNQIENAEFIVGKAEEVLPKMHRERKPDVIVVDPPRKGLDPVVIQTILEAAPERIVYVSCDSATLARDLKLFTDSGDYRIEKVQPVDMFSHSIHVECVTLLEKRGSE